MSSWFLHQSSLSAAATHSISGSDFVTFPGDDTILEETGKVYNKKVAKKGDDDKKKGGDDAGKKMDKGKQRFYCKCQFRFRQLCKCNSF